MVDGRRRAKVASEDEVRAWLRHYRDEHAEDDPYAVHVQVLRLSRWSLVTGGSLVPREEFFHDPPEPVAEVQG